jgi:hypothetical protein
MVKDSLWEVITVPKMTVFMRDSEWQRVFMTIAVLLTFRLVERTNGGMSMLAILNMELPSGLFGGSVDWTCI